MWVSPTKSPGGLTRAALNYHVYIDGNGIIFDAALNQTNSGRNNNKFYRVQVCHR